MKRLFTLVIVAIMLLTLLFTGCKAVTTATTSAQAETTVATTSAQAETTVAKKIPKIAFIFVSMEAEFWVASHKFITESLKSKGVEVIERNAQEDATKQLEMIKDAIAQKVDAVILIPQDGEEAVTAGKLCNEAGIPIGVYARPPSNKDAKYVVVLSDNYDIAVKSMTDMDKTAQKKFQETGEKITPLIVLGDLGDPNAIERKNGFYDVINQNKDIYNTPIEIPGKWDAATCSANLTTAFQANPNIDFIFAPSDVYLAPTQAVLTNAGKWFKWDDPKHIILGSIDGGSFAGKLIDEGYLDAEGIHDLDAQAKIMIDAIMKAIETGDKTPEAWVQTPSFALTQYNNAERRMEMWGNILRKEKGEI